MQLSKTPASRRDNNTVVSARRRMARLPIGLGSICLPGRAFVCRETDDVAGIAGSIVRKRLQGSERRI
jgi:hypothetical protein